METSTRVRPPAVAGMFYEGNPTVLAQEVVSYLTEAPALACRPKALIVPHAGHVYSGAIAASAYRLLAQRAGEIRRVVLLGPVHRVPVQGLATSSAEYFRTPLGDVPLDRAAIAAACRLPGVAENDLAHQQEHSLEVQLPFLQAVLDDFTLVPFAVGNASGEQVAAVIDLLWGGDETLIVISSDLSHFHTYAQAQLIDRATSDSILHLTPLTSHEQACGATPVNGMLLAAQHHGLRPTLLDLRNSGDTAGDHSRVVGYASFAFCPTEEPHHV